MQRPFILNPGYPGLAIPVEKGEAAGAGAEQLPDACCRHPVFCNSKYRSQTDHTQLWVVPRCPDPPNLALWFQPFHNPGYPGLSWNARGYTSINPRTWVVLIENNGVLKIELDNQNTSRTSEYSFGELRMSGVHIHYVLCAQIHR